MMMSEEGGTHLFGTGIFRILIANYWMVLDEACLSRAAGLGK